jgi:hypothetical protein
MIEGAPIDFWAFTLGKLNAIVRRDGADFERHGFGQVIEEVLGDYARGMRMEPGIGELRRAINDHKQIQLAVFRLHFGNADVEIANRVSCKLLFLRLIAFNLRQPLMPFRCGTVRCEPPLNRHILYTSISEKYSIIAMNGSMFWHSRRSEHALHQIRRQLQALRL